MGEGNGKCFLTESTRTFDADFSDPSSSRLSLVSSHFDFLRRSHPSPFSLVSPHRFTPHQTFSQITSLTDVQEGTIARAITRLDETCREVRDAARIVGNSELFTKMEQCQLKIRRDIVFAASLYFSGATTTS